MKIFAFVLWCLIIFLSICGIGLISQGKSIESDLVTLRIMLIFIVGRIYEVPSFGSFKDDGL